MLVKALYYKHSFYVLKKDNEYGAKKITPKLIDLFEAARGGVKDHRIKDQTPPRVVDGLLGGDGGALKRGGNQVAPRA